MENLNDSKTLAVEIAKILDQKKAKDVQVLKVDDLTVLTDYFVIASGTSTTQVGSLADEVEYQLRASSPITPRALTPKIGCCWIIPTLSCTFLCRAPAPTMTWSICGQMASRWISRLTSPRTARWNNPSHTVFGKKPAAKGRLWERKVWS